MILDASAILAILQKEPEAEVMSAALAKAPSVAISAPTLLEIGIVTEARAGAAIAVEVERLLAAVSAQVVPFTAGHARVALEGWRRYGKGRHPAALNQGDCFAYALAKSSGEPLLFQGTDFGRTDVRVAI